MQQQAAIEAALLPKLNQELKDYLGAFFSLKNGDKPHEMSF